MTERLEAIAAHKRLYGDAYQDHGLLVCQENGLPLEPNRLGQLFRNWQRKSGIDLPYIKYHELRHSGATMLYDLCNNAKKVQGITGHASAKMVHDVYGHAHRQQQVDLVQQVQGTLYGKSASTSPEDSVIEGLLAAMQKDPLMQQRVLSALLARASA